MDTKEKILHIAHELFSKEGFHGVSVRDISKKAKVNVASISYHFGGKDDLIKAVIEFSFSNLRNFLEEVEKKNQSIEDFAIEFFYFLNNRRSEFQHIFKTLFFETKSEYCQFNLSDDSLYGPPGSGILLMRLKKDYPGKELRDYLWVIRVMYSMVMHQILVLSAHSLQTNSELMYSSEDDALYTIKKLVKSLLNELSA